MYSSKILGVVTGNEINFIGRIRVNDRKKVCGRSGNC